MAGAFSGHLLDSYNTTMQRPLAAPVFGQPQSRVVTSGAMSFDASMHGSFRSTNSFADHPFSMDMSDDTAIKIATLQAKLNKKLGPEYISQRPGPGGGPKLTYAEGWKIINIANEVFGFNGWSSQIVNMTTDYMDYNEESKRCNVGVSCIVRVTLSCGVFHEDVGYGAAENAKGKAQAIDKSKKEAVTDAVKRALRNFGSLLGNCLYDKSYTQEITKIKVPPAKFDKSELYRRPEFDDTKPNLTRSTSSMVAPASVQTVSQTPAIAPVVKTNTVVVKSEPAQGAEAPITYIPRHLRQEMALGASGSTNATPIRNDQASGNGHGTTNGLNTPIHTPVQRAGNANRGQYRQTVPSPLVQPEQRHVSFAEPAAEPPPADEVDLPVADETSYSIDSEDDEFYANVDLGDGDLGRPIDFEEGMSGVSVSDVTFDQGEAGATSGNPRESSKALQGRPVHGHEISNSGKCEVTAPGGSGFSHSNAPRFQAGPSTASTAHHGLNDAVGAPAPPTKTRESSSSASTSSEARRSMPSMGGFHFPPGMNPAAQQPKLMGLPQPPNWTTGSASSSSNSSGLKRKADNMQTSSSSSRSLQGLGLAQQQQSVAGNPNGTRRPLANLDVSAGGDIKRAKR